MSNESNKSLEERGKEFSERLDKWSNAHLADPDKPECPICAGVKWMFSGNRANLGSIAVYPRYCTSCGYTMFFNSEMIK